MDDSEHIRLIRVLIETAETLIEEIGESESKIEAAVWELTDYARSLYIKYCLEVNPEMNGTKLRRLFLCRAEFIRPLAVGGYPHSGYIRDDRWRGNVVGRMNSTLL